MQLARLSHLTRLNDLPQRVYLGRVLRSDGTPASTSVDVYATRESAVLWSRRMKRLGFRLTLKLVNAWW